MLQLRYRVVDVFTDHPLAGNAVFVVLDPCPAHLMALIARESNLSETTFPTITTPGCYTVRIFTPRAELPFAGHPTLGTAWTLGPGRWVQSSAGATVAVEVDGAGARMVQPVPTLTAVESHAPGALGLASADGCWVAEAGGVRHLVVLTEAPLDGLSPDLVAVAAAAGRAGATTVAAVHRIDDANLHVRVFVPAAGIPEDPGTGSVAGPIALLTRSSWGTNTAVVVHQGAEMGRPCRIEVDLGPDGPVVGGCVTACAEGRLTL